MEFKLGTYDLFNVIQVEPQYYTIRNKEASLRLYKTAATKELEIGDKVEVFVYMNQAKKVVATMKKPYIDEETAAWVKVVEVKHGLGVFVDVGLDKDMLVSKDDLPVLKKEWPNLGDSLFCVLRSGKNQIIAKPVSRFKMRDYLTINKPLEIDEKVNAYVFYLADEGWVMFTKEGHEIFVYYKHSREKYRLGQEVEVTITIVKDEGHYNGTALEQKELMLDRDAARIVDYLENHQGVMPFTDKSDPQLIQETFKMSKAAFKRALGTLYKQKVVMLEKDKTVLSK